LRPFIAQDDTRVVIISKTCVYTVQDIASFNANANIDNKTRIPFLSIELCTGPCNTHIVFTNYIGIAPKSPQRLTSEKLLTSIIPDIYENEKTE